VLIEIVELGNGKFQPGDWVTSVFRLDDKPSLKHLLIERVKTYQNGDQDWLVATYPTALVGVDAGVTTMQP
jgi:hypothetical protein